MNPLTLLQESGAVRAVSGFAAEAVFGLPAGAQSPARSARSRAIAKLRRDFVNPVDLSPLTYAQADTLYRRAFRAAQRAEREAERQETYTIRGVEPPLIRSRTGETRQARYGVYVSIVSPRTGKEYKGQVIVTAPLGTSASILSEMARQTVISRQVASQSVRGSRGYATDVRQNWQVEDAAIRWIEEL